MKPDPAKVMLGNGEGTALMVWPQMAPASEWKIASRPMNTTTTDKIGAWCSGRRMMRSIATPSKKENSATASRAAQKLTPHSSSYHTR